MPKIIDSYYITDEARKKFRIWLVENDLTFTEFAKRCGASRQNLDLVVKGKRKITPTMKEWFKKGGYDQL